MLTLLIENTEMNNTNLLLISIRAALMAGKAIMDIYTDPNSDFEIERKADNSPLTLADKAAHIEIINILTTTPYPVLSEEGAEIPYADRAQWKSLWIVDPLDGTKEFIKRNGEFTVNIALVENGIPVLGVIYVPVKKELYFGFEKEGGYRLSGIDNDNVPDDWSKLKEEARRLPVLINREEMVVVASRSHMSEETIIYIEALKKQGRPIVTKSSGSSLKICMVAEGEADIYPRFAPTMEWDTAAGHAIARAAGFEIYQKDEKTPLQYNKENLLNPWFIVR